MQETGTKKAGRKKKEGLHSKQWIYSYSVYFALLCTRYWPHAFSKCDIAESMYIPTLAKY
eukprot:836351-Ditylum_brightwellii.AAC.1